MEGKDTDTHTADRASAYAHRWLSQCVSHTFGSGATFGEFGAPYIPFNKLQVSESDP